MISNKSILQLRLSRAGGFLVHPSRVNAHATKQCLQETCQVPAQMSPASQEILSVKEANAILNIPGAGFKKKKWEDCTVPQ